MPWSLIISSFLIGASIFLFLLAVKESYDGFWLELSLFIIVGAAIIGLSMFGILVDAKTETILINDFQYYKFKDRVVIVAYDKVWWYKDIEIFSEISSKPKVEVLQTYNSYGSVISTTLLINGKKF